LDNPRRPKGSVVTAAALLAGLALGGAAAYAVLRAILDRVGDPPPAVRTPAARP
jgi:hypothetical protein